MSRTLSRREALAAGAVGLLGASRSGLAATPPAPAPYLEDSRTARAARLSIPRTPLRETLRVLSQVAGIELTAAPTLAEESLVGFVPRRPIRETMQALETLFQARWTRNSGSSRYLLSPDPKQLQAEADAQAAAMKRIRARLDAQAAQVAKLTTPPPEDAPQPEAPTALLWQHLPTADRDRVLRGASVTFSIPLEKVGPLNVMMVNSSRREPAPLTEPVLATFDLDYDLDIREGQGSLALRARATGRRENSLIAVIGIQDLSKLAQAAKAPPFEEMPGGEPFPTKVGGTGRFFGGRDEILLRLAEVCGVPILSRHRPQKQTTTITAGGQTFSTVLANIAAAYDAKPTLTARGFGLLRDTAAVPDFPLHTPAQILTDYEKNRPPVSRVVTLEQMSPLSTLTPGQLALLAATNRYNAEARFLTGSPGREDTAIQAAAYALVRFHAALSPEQRQALASDAGLDAATLTHRQLHLLIDARSKRGDFDVFPHMGQLRGLHLRFRTYPERKEDNLTLQALRDGMSVAGIALNLPTVEEPPKPTAAT